MRKSYLFDIVIVMELQEAPKAVESTPTGASKGFLDKASQRLQKDPALGFVMDRLSGTKTSAALTAFFGLSSYAQADEGSVVGAVMTGVLAAEIAVLAGVNAVRNRKAAQQNKPE